MDKRLIFTMIGLAALALTARADGVRGTANARETATPGAHAPLVVIDPGHGGGNTGAAGVTHTIHEKHLTLTLAQSLAERLQDLGYRVRMTRDRDEYLTLRQRVAFANRVDADLFLSVHANATPTHAQRGYETYVLSPRGLDVDGRALRLEEGRQRLGPSSEVAAILEDVERGLAQDTAADLAARIQKRLGTVWDRADDRGVKQDAMHVLLGATMPAVLIEVGFVDHAIEGHALLDPAVQTRVCDALADAVHSTLRPKQGTE